MYIKEDEKKFSSEIKKKLIKKSERHANQFTQLTFSLVFICGKNA